MKKPALLVVLLILIIVALSVVRTYVANNIATSGVVLGKVEEKIQKLETENTVLAEQLYSQTSLHNIYSKASSDGFVGSKTSYVLTQQPVAFKQ